MLRNLERQESGWTLDRMSEVSGGWSERDYESEPPETWRDQVLDGWRVPPDWTTLMRSDVGVRALPDCTLERVNVQIGRSGPYPRAERNSSFVSFAYALAWPQRDVLRFGGFVRRWNAGGVLVPTPEKRAQTGTASASRRTKRTRPGRRICTCTCSRRRRTPRRRRAPRGGISWSGRRSRTGLGYGGTATRSPRRATRRSGFRRARSSAAFTRYRSPCQVSPSATSRARGETQGVPSRDATCGAGAFLNISRRKCSESGRGLGRLDVGAGPLHDLAAPPAQRGVAAVLPVLCVYRDEVLPAAERRSCPLVLALHLAFKRTAPAVRRCKNEQERCSYGRETGRRARRYHLLVRTWPEGSALTTSYRLAAGHLCPAGAPSGILCGPSRSARDADAFENSIDGGPPFISAGRPALALRVRVLRV